MQYKNVRISSQMRRYKSRKIESSCNTKMTSIAERYRSQYGDYAIEMYCITWVVA